MFALSVTLPPQKVVGPLAVMVAAGAEFTVTARAEEVVPHEPLLTTTV